MKQKRLKRLLCLLLLFPIVTAGAGLDVISVQAESSGIGLIGLSLALGGYAWIKDAKEENEDA